MRNIHKSMYENYKKILEELKANSLHRNINPIKKHGKYLDIDSKSYLNLSSNDYLGLAENRAVIGSFLKNCDFSLGSASSRLLTGNSYIYHELESLLASIYKKEKALLFNSGYHANVGIMSSLLNKKDVVFSDKLNHASIIDGIKLSEAKMFRYKHLDYIHLEKLLKEHRNEYQNAIIVSESLFSMDGDFCDFGKLIELKKKYNAAEVKAMLSENCAEFENRLAEQRARITDLVAENKKLQASVEIYKNKEENIITFVTNPNVVVTSTSALPKGVTFLNNVLTIPAEFDYSIEKMANKS